MSDDEDDLFGGSDSDDTNELLAASSAGNNKRLKKKTAAAPKKPAIKKAVAKKPKSDDESSDGMFDDSDDDNEKKKKGEKKPAAVEKKELSKKERMEALAKRHRSTSEPEKKERKNDNNDTKKKDSGYESENSIDSADFQRTADDDAFIDTTGEDADAVQELYAAQHFDDEEAEEDGYDRKKKKKRRHGEAEDIGGGGGGNEPDNPIMAAVHRMKKKKKEKRTLSEMEEECKIILSKMEQAAQQDDALIAQRKPATHKLIMLNEVVDMLTRRDMQRMLLDLDVLAIAKRWIQPLPNGTLGNVTVRQRLLHAIAGMTGESGINANDLKRSEFGRVVMVLYKHKSETPAMKQLLKQLIEQWSRPIFQKSGNMRDLERVLPNRGAQGLAALSRQQQQLQARMEAQAGRKGQAEQDHDLQSLIASGKKGPESGINRVRVPYSKGFAFSVRPGAKVVAPAGSANAVLIDKRRVAVSATASAADTRGKLAKRILEKGRTVSKNQRSANISVEGRATK